MAAAEYLTTPLTWRAFEDRLEIQAQHIDQQTLLFQAQLRGFLLRHRVFRHRKDDDAIVNQGHFTSTNTWSPQDTYSTITDAFDDLRTSITNKVLNKYTRNFKDPPYGDDYLEWENVDGFDAGHTPGQAESMDVQAYYQEPANESECDQSYGNTYEITDNTVGR